MYCQRGNIELKLSSFESKNINVDSSTATSALKISNAVFNSEEFKTEITKLNFKCENLGERCSGRRITGVEILDQINSSPIRNLDLLMKNCSREYGRAGKGKNYIQSCYKTLRKDDDILPFSYIYAYHICHEYMHIIGYYHTDHKDDVAEKVGWIAYEILNKWLKENRDLN